MLWTVVLFCLVGGLVEVTEGSAFLSVKFLTFRNWRGLGSNGHCCDGKWGVCFSPCDHSFNVCVDQVDGPHNNYYHCTYGRKYSGEISNANYISFRSRVGRLNNPFSYELDHWPGEVLLKIDINDVDPDHNSNDDVDFFNRVVSLRPTRSTRGTIIELRQRVTLTLELRVFCSRDHYGGNCSVHCKAQNSNIHGHYYCDGNTGAKICNPGWEGPNCNKNINDCRGVLCQNGGTCNDRLNSFTCTCAAGFEGRLCEHDVNECLRHDLCVHGSCVNSPGSFSCDCHTGYSGRKCDIDIDDCASQPCLNGAHCIDGVDMVDCICQPGYQGELCADDVDECLMDICSNNGTCINSPGSYRCECTTEYQGPHCTQDVDECGSNPCQNGSSCVNLHGSFRCDCVRGFEGELCADDVDECLMDICSNNGTCINSPGSYRCECTTEYQGPHCTQDVDECGSNACQNGASCVNLHGSFRCDCDQGFEGPLCATDINECDDDYNNNNNNTNDNDYNNNNNNTNDNDNDNNNNNNNNNTNDDNNNNNNNNATLCQNGGLCENTNGSYLCTCAVGFQGRHCDVDVDECEADVCVNATNCTNTHGGFHCSCGGGFTGQLCDTNIDECLLDVCQNGGNCSDTIGSFLCACPDYWEGPRCEQNVDECERSPCYNGSVCVDIEQGFRCDCPQGMWGDLCGEDIDECARDVCRNGANCTNTFGSFVCSCERGWSGEVCDVDEDECASEICEHQAVCVNMAGGYSCECPRNWTGDRCQLDVDECRGEDVPCRNNATCVNLIGSFHCECLDGWQGYVCGEDVDECREVARVCEENSAGNNSTGNNSAGNNSTGNNSTGNNSTGNNSSLSAGTNETSLVTSHFVCVNTQPGYKCVCESGWTGDRCDVDIDECSTPTDHDAWNNTSMAPGVPGSHTEVVTSYDEDENKSVHLVPTEESAEPKMSVPFYLACRLGPNDFQTVDREFVKLLSDVTGLAPDVFSVSYKFEFTHLEDGQVLTSVHPTVLLGGVLMSTSEVTDLLRGVNVTAQVNRRFQCPLYLHAVPAKIGYSQQPSESSGFSWYPYVIAGVACCLIAVLIVFLVVWRRRHRGCSGGKYFVKDDGNRSTFYSDTTCVLSQPGELGHGMGQGAPGVRENPLYEPEDNGLSITNPMYEPADEQIQQPGVQDPAVRSNNPDSPGEPPQETTLGTFSGEYCSADVGWTPVCQAGHVSEAGQGTAVGGTDNNDVSSPNTSTDEPAAASSRRLPPSPTRHTPPPPDHWYASIDDRVLTDDVTTPQPPGHYELEETPPTHINNPLDLTQLLHVSAPSQQSHCKQFNQTTTELPAEQARSRPSVNASLAQEKLPPKSLSRKAATKENSDTKPKEKRDRFEEPLETILGCLFEPPPTTANPSDADRPGKRELPPGSSRETVNTQTTSEPRYKVPPSPHRAQPRRDTADPFPHLPYIDDLSLPQFV
ncbi:protein jagged-1 [Aplysia californica]|uniref:Delta-like protein n=1 Tax=Aplysia californica TaxID=6500 RepID=A0ABM1W414_APLCA|nr:protein jagged-1 [Aplysia californica]